VTIYNACIFILFVGTVDFKHVLLKSRTLNLISDSSVPQEGHCSDVNCYFGPCISFLLKLIEKKTIKRIFSTTKKKMVGESRKFHSEERRNLYS
jgi:hypothetical protein